MLGRGGHRGAFDRGQEHPSETRRVKAGVDDTFAARRDSCFGISRVRAMEDEAKTEMFHDASWFFIQAQKYVLGIKGVSGSPREKKVWIQ